MNLKDAQETVEEACIYCGYLFPGYGHFILESLAMLYAIKSLPESCRLVFSYHENGLQNYQKEILSSFDIDYRRILFIDEPILFKKIYIPPAGYALGSWFLPEQQKALAIYSSNPIPGKKVYISRRKYNPKRGAVNENCLEKLLLSRGWNVIYHETLSLHQQMEEWSTAETLFCIYGSALHSIVFLKNITQKFIIIPRDHGVTYNMLLDAKEIKEYYIFDVPKKNLTPDIINPVIRQWNWI